jgi:hypothetical protein
MAEQYYIMHNPLTFNLMDLHGNIQDTQELLAHLTGKDVSQLDSENYLDFLRFDLRKERQGMVETFGMESYASHYIANQLARLRPDSEIVLSDGKRRTLDRIIQERGKPEAVFVTSMSSNFPTTAATIIPLNHAGIPAVVGGIHVSTSPEDIDTFVRSGVPHPELVSQVRGAGDSKTLREIMQNIQNGGLKPEYIGYETMEDGVWGSENVATMDPMQMELLKRVPLVGGILGRKFRINAITPYLGCPYSCSFCSISTLPKEQRKFQSRSAEDFVAELQEYQKDGVDFSNRFFFFLPDNLLLGGKRLHRILDGIIESDLKVNYAAQISVEIANNESLLAKLRESGATHFFMGLESLDLRNLEAIGKNAVKDIKRKDLSVRDYYAQQIGKIQDYGISIHGAFILGMPHDYFRTPDDHTGVEIAEFCKEHKIGLQPCSLTDLPGSRNFAESQTNGNCIYGKQGTMDYLVSLCISDLTETNRTPPKSLHSSPLTVAYMAYDATQRAGSTWQAVKNGLFMARKSWQHPTKSGKLSLRDRLDDSICSFASQLVVSQYKDHADGVAYSNEVTKGSFERLYEAEKSPEVREIFGNFVQQFK